MSIGQALIGDFNIQKQERQTMMQRSTMQPCHLWPTGHLTPSQNVSTWSNATVADSYLAQYNTLAGIELRRRFYRINKLVEIREGEMFTEPLDELRLKIARWLN